jgi:DNA polymerase V
MKLIQHGTFIDIFSVVTETELSLPLVQSTISAGFPSPAEDFSEVGIDLNKELIGDSFSTFLGRVKGTSMQDEGIDDGDIMIIDKSLEPQDGKIAVCFIDGEFTVKKIKIEKDACYLIPANPNYKPIKVTEENDFLIWGMVTYVIKKFK